MEFTDEKKKLFLRSRMHVSIFLSYFLSIIEGTGLTWPSPLLKKLHGTEDNPLGRMISSNESSLLASLPVLGCCFGSFIIMTIAHRIGRKPLLTMLGIPSLLCFIILAFSRNIWFYYIARVAAGLNSAASSVLVPMYICELADSKSRGRFASGMLVSNNIGILITYCLGAYMPFFWFHICLMILPVSFMVSFSIFGLESPYHFLQSDPARSETLLRKQKEVDDVSKTLNAMTRSYSHNSDGNFFSKIKTRKTRQALLTGLGLVTFTMFSGTTIIIPYSQFIFDTAGGTWSSELNDIITGFVLLAASIVSSFIMDKYERRRMLSLSAVSIGIFIGFLSLYLILKDHGVDVEKFGWVPLICFLGLGSSYNLGLGPLWNTVLGEVFPPKMRNSAMALCGLWSATLGFSLTLIFTRVGKSVGLGETFIFFSVMSIFAAAYVKVFIVETKGKTLEEIQIDLDILDARKMSLSRRISVSLFA